MTDMSDNTTTCFDCGKNFPDRDMVQHLETTGGELCGECAKNRAQCLMSWLDLSDEEWEATPDTVKEKLWVVYKNIPDEEEITGSAG